MIIEGRILESKTQVGNIEKGGKIWAFKKYEEIIILEPLPSACALELTYARGLSCHLAERAEMCLV